MNVNGNKYKKLVRTVLPEWMPCLFVAHLPPLQLSCIRPKYSMTGQCYSYDTTIRKK